MRIAIYMENYDWGGIETRLLNLLDGWPQKNQDHITIFANTTYPGFRNIMDQLSHHKNVSVKLFDIQSLEVFLQKYRHSRWFLPIKIASYPMLWFFFLKLRKQSLFLLKNHGPFDCLLSDNGGYPGGWGSLASIVAAHKLNIKKRILTIHHCAVPPRPLKKIFENYIDKLMFKLCTEIVTVSNATGETLRRHRKNFANLKTKTIYNSVPYPVCLNSASVTDLNLRQKYKLEGKILIGMVGHIERYKGLDDLIEALGLLKIELLKNVQILLIGAGDETEKVRLQQLARTRKVLENILFTGYLAGSPQKIISQLDLLAMLTKDFEGFGFTLAEAMSVGTPVLATRVGAVPEFITHKVSGFLVNPSSPIEISEALEDFLTNREEWLQRAEKAKKHIALFSNERLGRELSTLIHG